jgi:hypothetical protein
MWVHIITRLLQAYIFHNWSRDSVVGIATDYGLDDGGVGVRVPVGSRIFFFITSCRPALGPTQLPIQWVLVAPPEVKRPGREASPPYAFIA